MVTGNGDTALTWTGIIERLRSCSRGRASAIVSVTILVNEQGLPELMTRPEVTPIEPASGDPAALLKLLALRRGTNAALAEEGN